MSTADLQDAIAAFVAERQAAAPEAVPARVIEGHVDRPRSSVNRALEALVRAGRLARVGAGRSTAYKTRQPLPAVPAAVTSAKAEPAPSEEAKALLALLTRPIATRQPVSYQRSFVDAYRPNESSLLPADRALQLYEAGKARDQQPAGTYARKVLEQLLIDLSWFSSRLEGNRTSLLATRELFEKGRSQTDDRDATMLLNHKESIEFMVDAVPTEGITVPVVRNVQSLLMRDLLADPADLGAIRTKIVNIQDTVYVPSQVPDLLEEMLGRIVDKARDIRNPVEASFFLWVNIAYLQPFVDGNKRTSRLAANMPLMLANCAPLSFLDVGQHDYTLAMLGVYERLDVTLAVALFERTYRRSIAKYQVVVEAMGAPDPLRVKYREQLGEAVRQVVYFGRSALLAVQDLGVPAADALVFDRMLKTELQHLEPYNCARYRLPIAKTQEWVQKGRPQ